jgi:hypothetical protein
MGNIPAINREKQSFMRWILAYFNKSNEINIFEWSNNFPAMKQIPKKPPISAPKDDRCP